MIITDIKRFISAVQKYYPHYGNILNIQHFKFDKNGYFVISTKVKQFQHLRIVQDDIEPNKTYDFNINHIKEIMTYNLGASSIGLYVLPERKNVKCGIPMEHVFSYNGIQTDFNSVFYKTSKFDSVIKSVIQYDEQFDKIIGNFKVMKIQNKAGFKYCNYTATTESIFNFYSLQNAKDINMSIPMTPMVIPIHTGTKNNSDIKILPWNQKNIPDLSNLYDYSKSVPNPPAIQKIIMEACR